MLIDGFKSLDLNINLNEDKHLKKLLVELHEKMNEHNKMADEIKLMKINIENYANSLDHKDILKLVDIMNQLSPRT